MKYKEIHFETIDSTNSYLKSHYEELEDFTIVSTDYQSEGRGRGEHKWTSPKGDNLLFSILIKDEKIRNEYKSLPLIAGYLVAYYFEKELGLKPMVKWPNDIYIDGKKISGLLCEGDISKFIVIGIGINVNQTEFNGLYSRFPTSIALLGKPIKNLGVFRENLFSYLVDNLSDINKAKCNAMSYINSHNFLLNKEVEFIYDNERLSGVVLGLDEEFNLVVNVNGSDYHLFSGEISIKE